MTKTNLKPRPTSPHLQKYRWSWTMLASITHRFTGVALTVGMAFLAGKLFFFAFFSPEVFNSIMLLSEGHIYRGLKFCFLWSISYHLLSGVRHLIQDVGGLYGLRSNTFVVAVIFLTATIFSIWFIYI